MAILTRDQKIWLQQMRLGRVTHQEVKARSVDRDTTRLSQMVLDLLEVVERQQVRIRSLESSRYRAKHGSV